MSLYVAKEDGSIKKIRDKGTFGIYNGSKPITKIYTERKKNGVSYIPHDIDFEIVNGTTPTLHAGSEVWVPYGKAAPALNIGDSLNSGIITAISWDGSRLFYKVRYDTDLSIDITSDPASAEFVTSISPAHSFWWFAFHYSQDTAPSNFGQYALWWDSSTNIVKITIDSGATWQNYGSLPIGVFTMAGTGATKKVKHVFNGFGYLGCEIYALPGVKGLEANGMAEGGGFLNTERVLETVISRQLSFNREKFYGLILSDRNGIDGDDYIVAAELPDPVPSGYVFCYRTSDNTLWWTENVGVWARAYGFKIGWFGSDSKKITAFHADNSFAKVYQYNSYEPNTVLCNISNDASTTVHMRKGVYYIRGQGAGGGGGRNGYFGNGQGGGSGAGFEGYVYLKVDYGNMVITAGVGGTEAYNGNPGTDTVIGQLITLGGGKGGAGENNAHVANAGILTINSSDNWEILSYTVKSNGNQGLEASNSASFISGGNSVLTGDGGGPTSDSNHDASAPGAGGGGGWAYNSSGGAGGDGECLIQYIGYEPEGGVTNLEYFKTPTLTGSITPVAEGNIVVSSSYNNTTTWNNLCNNSYIMRNTISTKTDQGYWQMNGSSTQWLNIHFPYTLLIKELTIASRPSDNYSGTVTAYTSSHMTRSMGSVTTNKPATNFLLTRNNNGAFETSNIYLRITDMDEWYGLQNLQIRGYKVKKKKYLVNEPSVEPTEPTYYCYDYDTLDGYFYTLGEAVVGSTVLRTSDNAVTTSPDNLSANNDVSITAVNGDVLTLGPYSFTATRYPAGDIY